MTESTWNALTTIYDQQADQLADALQEADAVVVG
ncbi:deacetylase SIR2, partial [Mammaliicoccus sciuri]